MNKHWVLKMINSNRELIQRNNADAIDDLEQLWEEYGQIKDDEIKLGLEFNKAMTELSFYSRYEKGLESSLATIQKFENTDYRNTLARHYWLAAQCLAFMGRHEEAVAKINEGQLILDENQPGYLQVLTDFLHLLAINCELKEPGSPESLNYLEKSLELLKGNSNIIRHTNTLMSIGNVKLNMGLVKEALDFFYKAAEVFEQFYDLPNMASVYSNIGTAYYKIEEWDKAEEYLSKSLELRKKFGTPVHLSISYYNLGLLYKDQNRLKPAFEALNRSRQILLNSGSKLYMDMTMKQLSEVAELMGDPLAIV